MLLLWSTIVTTSPAEDTSFQSELWMRKVCYVGSRSLGRPVARRFDDGFTAEVARTCTDGTPNANSALYGAAWRSAKGMGYRRLITYTQEGEAGTSLRAAGWTVIAERKPRGSWSDDSIKLRDIRDPIGVGGLARTLWEVS